VRSSNVSAFCPNRESASSIAVSRASSGANRRQSLLLFHFDAARDIIEVKSDSEAPVRIDLTQYRKQEEPRET
jgi:hypothetical protein